MPWYFPVRVLPQCRGFLPVAVFFALLFGLFPAATPEAQAAQVTVAWDADSNPDVAGYKVYVGTASRNYSLFYEVGKVFRCTIPDLQEGTTFYFAATARDGYGHESDFSEELVYQVPRSDEVPIVPVNHAPVARNGVFSTAQGTPGSGVLIATDPDGDILTYAIAGQGTKGTAAITNAAGGTYLYTPNAGASGSDSFTFQVRDPGNLTSTATIAVTIAPGNQPPVAGNGALSTVQNTPAAGKLTATDVDGDPLTYQVVRAAKQGSVALNAATGSFTYTPNANSSGADTFTFKANDGKADSNVASFTVTVNTSTPNPPTLNVSPTSAAKGRTVTATFSGVANPMPEDWIGLSAEGTADRLVISWIYDSSCGNVPGIARAGGSCQYPLPANLTAGTYQLHLFSNGTWTRLAVSNSFTVNAATPGTATLAVSPTSATAGGTVTATFSNVSSPTSRDWIGVYAQGAADTAYMTWFYDSTCTFTPGTAMASGSCSYTVPTDLMAGSYELRLFTNDSWTCLAVSNVFTVTQGSSAASLTATPTTVATGGTVTATFRNVAAPTSLDWIGVYAQGSADTVYKTWFYGSTCTFTPSTAKASGSCSYTVPANLPAGLYEFRLFANNGWTRLAVSKSFAVTGGSSAASLSVIPITVTAGGMITATFSNIDKPMAEDWIGLYFSGTADTAWSDYFYAGSCTRTPGPARASGSCQYSVPASLAGGTYELRLFSNGSSTRLAVGNTFSVY